MTEQLHTDSKDETLGLLLRKSAVGELALFAVLFDESDAKELAKPGAATDSRARAIYEVFKVFNADTSTDADDYYELGTSLDFREDPSEFMNPVGRIVYESQHIPMFGQMVPTWCVRLSVEDADYLLGVLPDELLDQTAAYSNDEE